MEKKKKNQEDVYSEMVYIYSREYLALYMLESTQWHRINVLPSGISILPKDFFFFFFWRKSVFTDRPLIFIFIYFKTNMTIWDRMQNLLEVLSEIRGFKEILSFGKIVYSRTCMIYIWKIL